MKRSGFPEDGPALAEGYSEVGRQLVHISMGGVALLLRWITPSEALVIASRAGLRVTQVPVDMRPRASGAPSQSWLKSMVYDQSLKWQRLSFDALRVFEKNDDLFHLRFA